MASQLVVVDPKKEIHFPGKKLSTFLYSFTDSHTQSFLGPYDKEYTTFLKIENVSKNVVVAFRLMTLEAKNYLCDPSKGIIQPQQSAIVNIKLLPIKNEATFKTGAQKFLVQVVPAKPTSTFENVSELVRIMIKL